MSASVISDIFPTELLNKNFNILDNSTCEKLNITGSKSNCLLILRLNCGKSISKGTRDKYYCNEKISCKNISYDLVENLINEALSSLDKSIKTNNFGLPIPFSTRSQSQIFTKNDYSLEDNSLTDIEVNANSLIPLRNDKELIFAIENLAIKIYEPLAISTTRKTPKANVLANSKPINLKQIKFALLDICIETKTRSNSVKKRRSDDVEQLSSKKLKKKI